MFKKLKMSYSYDDVTLVPAYSELTSRSDTSTASYGYNLPIIGSCMDTLGFKIMECLTSKNIPFIAHRAFKSAEEQFKYFTNFDNIVKQAGPVYYKNVWFAVGSVGKYKQWILWLYFHGVRNFCVDMAHGDSKACIDTIKFIKKLEYTDKQNYLTNNNSNDYVLSTKNNPIHVIAGNVATAAGFKRLQKAGADGIRVGIASGSICSTNIETGMGLPILTSIIECAKVKKKNVWLIADGGIRSAGDIAKAIYFGADFCMLGKLLAATDLADGKAYNKNMQEINSDNIIYPENFKVIVAEKISADIANGKITNKINKSRYYKDAENNTIMYKGYHGMASRSARNNLLSYAGVEGAEGLLKYTGKTSEFILDTKLRLQSSLSYGGAKNWNEFRQNVKAYLRTSSANTAAGIHLDVITKLH
jgi:IMP dehydrogenase/GMP reductase